VILVLHVARMQIEDCLLYCVSISKQKVFNLHTACIVHKILGLFFFETF